MRRHLRTAAAAPLPPFGRPRHRICFSQHCAATAPRLCVHAQHEVHYDGGQQKEAEHCRPEAVVVGPRAALADGGCAPVVRHERVRHGGHCDKREQRGRVAADLVAEIEQADGKAAENDGEVQPRQKRALVREEHLRLDPHRQRNALAVAPS